MKWRRCPRCNSGRVIFIKHKANGCFGCLAFGAVIFGIIEIIAMLVMRFKAEPIATSISCIVIVLVVWFFLFLNKRFGQPTYSLYCKDCELNFKTENDE